MATDGSTASTERRRVRVAVEGTAMARVSSVISTETTVEETDSATWVSMNSDQQKHEPTIATASRTLRTRAEYRPRRQVSQIAKSRTIPATLA
jgi:hypothetical protein